MALKLFKLEKKWFQATLSNQLMMLGIDINSNGIYKIGKGVSIVKEFGLSGIANVLGVAKPDLLKEFRDNL